MDYKQLYAKCLKYLMSRGYTLEHNRTTAGTLAYPKDSGLCTLCVFYWSSYKGNTVSVWKTDAYPEDCHDIDALMLMGCKLATSTLKSSVVEPKPTESYIPTWVRDLF